MGQRWARWLGGSSTRMRWGTGERSVPRGRVGQVQELGRGALGHGRRSGPHGGSGSMLRYDRGSELARGRAGLDARPYEGLLSGSRAKDGWDVGEPFV